MPWRRRHLTGWAPLVVSVVVLSVLTACGTADGHAGASAEKVTATAGVPRAQADRRNPPEIDAIAAYAAKNFPQSFTGVSAAGDTTVVHRVPRADEALRDALAQRFPTAALRFSDTPRTLDELETLTQRILRDAEELRSEGVRIAEVGPDITRGVVVVTTDDVEAARSLLPQRYGDGVRVEGPAPEVTFAG